MKTCFSNSSFREPGGLPSNNIQISSVFCIFIVTKYTRIGTYAVSKNNRQGISWRYTEYKLNAQGWLNTRVKVHILTIREYPKRHSSYLSDSGDTFLPLIRYAKKYTNMRTCTLLCRPIRTQRNVSRTVTLHSESRVTNQFIQIVYVTKHLKLKLRNFDWR